MVELTGQPKKLFCVVSPSAAATLSPLRPPCSSPHCAGCFPPAPASPHSPAILPPRSRDQSKPFLGRPHCAAASRPPLPGPPWRGASRRYRCPSPLARLGGWPPPLRPQPRRWRGVARPAPGAGHSSPRRHPDTLRGRDPRLGSGWNSLAGARSPPPRPRASAFTRACARLRQAKRPA